MLRTTAIVLLAIGLASCDAVNTVTDGLKHAKEVENDLLLATGKKPQVGFSWNNSELTSVTVTFPGLYEAKPLRELAEAARASIGKHFKQMPGTIMLSFALRKSDPGTTAQAPAQ